MILSPLRRRLSISVAAAATFVVTSFATAAAWDVGSGEVVFSGVPSHGFCYTHSTTMFTTNTNHLQAGAFTRARVRTSAGACLINNHAVAPTNWMGARVWIYKKNGTLCGSSDWKYKGGNTADQFTPQISALSCNGKNVYSQGRSRGWIPTSSDYGTSNYYTSPYHAFP